MNNNENINNMTKDGTDDLPSDNIEALECRYNQILVEVVDAKNNLVNLRKKEEVLPYSDYNKINIMFWIMGIITFLILVNLTSYLLITLSSYLNVSLIFINIISVLVTVPFVGIVNILLFKKIRKIIQQKSYKKVINSDEYKQLMEDIRDASSVLDEKLVLERRITKALLECKSMCAISNAERSIRDVLSGYNCDHVCGNPTYKNGTKFYIRKLVRGRSNRDIK